MDKNRKQMNLIPRTIEYKGEEFFGIPTGIFGKNFSLTKILEMKNKPGWIVRDSLVEEWKITGFCQINDEIFLYGPGAEAISLEKTLDLDSERFLPYFLTLITSLLTLKNNSISLFRISTHSVFFLNNGGVLFLPPDIFTELINLRSFEDRMKVFTVYNHPDRSGENNLSFSLGVFLYRVLTGNFPFYSEKQEELHHMIRELSVASPRITRPGLKDDVIAIITAALNRKVTEIPSLKIWQDSVKTWIDQGIERVISEEEKLQVKESEEQKKENAVKQFRFKVFWRRNFVKIAVISAITIFIGTIAGVTINNIFFRTRNTAGFSPREVVQAYFDSINSLDYFTMSDCLVNDASKDELNTVMNLYVITRQRSAYEQSINFISAEEWDRKGRPPLEPYLLMYGVTKVTILEEQPAPEPVFIVSYEKWISETEETTQEYPGAKVMYFGTFIKARFFLKMDRKDWVIYSIEIIEEQDLSPDFLKEL